VKDYIHVGNASQLTNPANRRFYRFLEILPGLLAWGTLVFIIVISFLTPTFAAVFIILFDIYWLIKTIYLSLLTRSTFFQMRRNLKVNWSEKLNTLKENPKLPGTNWQDLYHLIILPAYKEPYQIIHDSLQAISKANYPKDKFLVVLATEERAGEHAIELARKAQNDFGNAFGQFLVTVHPFGLPDEIPGKGSNEAWAGQRAKESMIDKLGIQHERVIVSVFDIDTIVPPDFFACLTYHYLTAPNPLRASYQPIPLFTNNIWEAPAFARVFAFSCTFWQMIQQARREQLVTFSSQSIEFQS
jgi:hypothetical protein